MVVTFWNTEIALNSSFYFSTVAESNVVLQIHTNRCSWSLGLGSGDSVLLPLTQETKDTLTEQICQDLGCGAFSHLKEDISPNNATCLQACVHQDRQHLNCSKTIERNCSAISEVVCGKDAYPVKRLASELWLFLFCTEYRYTPNIQ